MAQTWLGSIAEAKTNIAIGFAINYAANLVVLPLLWDPSRPAWSAFLIGLVFTLISVTRQLVIRRWFNGIKRFEAQVLPGEPTHEATIAAATSFAARHPNQERVDPIDEAAAYIAGRP